MAMRCPEKHTKYQPSDDEWKCPKCGAGDGFFYIISDVGDYDCTKLHVEDEIVCEKCGYDTTGKTFAARLQKEKNMVQCPHCKGKGYIKLSNMIMKDKTHEHTE